MIVFDDLTDVVSAYIADARAESLRPAPSDGHMMLEIDPSGQVVGIELHYATHRVPERWRSHPDRTLLPADLLRELDRWLDHRWADRATAR